MNVIVRKEEAFYTYRSQETGGMHTTQGHMGKHQSGVRGSGANKDTGDRLTLPSFLSVASSGAGEGEE